MTQIVNKWKHLETKWKHLETNVFTNIFVKNVTSVVVTYQTIRSIVRQKNMQKKMPKICKKDTKNMQKEMPNICKNDTKNTKKKYQKSANKNAKEPRQSIT